MNCETWETGMDDPDEEAIPDGEPQAGTQHAGERARDKTEIAHRARDRQRRARALDEKPHQDIEPYE